jgi:serine/threonine-protein kinase
MNGPKAMPPTLNMDRQTFLENLRQSGLLSPQELREAVRNLPATDTGRATARQLIKQGLITRFQARLLLIGRTSGFQLGQYRILDEIGQGGMGRVFKAVHGTMNRVVALKVLAPNLMKTDRAQQLFQREVRAAGRLMHPNIVTAYDANQVDSRFYLVLEYVDGPNLDQLVRERGPLPVGLACDFIRQAALGLQHAHELGMVHRDIKPANLLVQRGATPATPCMVKILDFGLARLHAPIEPGRGADGTILTKDNTVMGTPDYLSPEQSRNLHKVDIRSDLYSLGCTLYYLLTGRVPFPGGNTLEKLIQHSTEKATPVEQLRPDLPAPVAAIVRRLMAKAPKERYATPAELAAELAPFAVPGTTEWAGQKAGAAAVAPGSDSGIEVPISPLVGSSEGSALVATLAPDLSPTPMSAEAAPEVPQLDQVWRQTFWALGGVVVLVILLVMLRLMIS